MPRYFFDLSDGDKFLADAEGTECRDRLAARQEAVGVLPEIARDKLTDGGCERRAFGVTVRDDAGEVFFRATLSLVAEWIDAGEGPSR